MKYKISIILPSYNSEKFLDRTLQSLINQTIFKDIELIIVDDCSTDNTREMIRRYSDKYSNIRFVFKEENSGEPSVGRNIGIKEASADYIMFLDHDDFYSADNVCEILYDKIVNEKVDLVSGTYTLVTSFEKRLASYFKDNIFIHNFKENLEILSYAPSIWSKIFKKEVISENNIRFPFGGTGDDLVFLINYIMHANGIIFLKEVSIIDYNRITDSSFSNSITEEYCYGLIKSYNLLKDIFKRHVNSPSLAHYLFSHTSFLLSQLAKSDLDVDSMKNILQESQPLYSYIKKQGLYFDASEYQLCLILIVKSNFDEAITVLNLIKDIMVKNLMIKNKNEFIKSKMEIIRTKNKTIENKNKVIENKNKVIKNKNKKLNDMVNTISWKITKPLRALNEMFKSLK